MASVSPSKKKRANSIVSANDAMGATERTAATLVKHPYAILVVVVILVGFLCSGVHKFEMEKDLEKLWIESGSEVQQETAYTNAHTYDHLGSETQLMVTIARNDPDSDNNVITPYILDKHFEVAKNMKNIVIELNGHTYRYEDVCSSVQPYLLQCTRVTVLDCFKEGAFDFTPYNSLYALDGVLDVVAETMAEGILPIAGETGAIAQAEVAVVEGAEAEFVGGIEDVLPAMSENGAILQAVANVVTGVEDASILGAVAEVTVGVEDASIVAAVADLVTSVEDASILGAVANVVTGVETNLILGT